MTKRRFLPILSLVLFAGITMAGFSGTGHAAESRKYVAVAVAPDGSIPSSEADTQDKAKKRKRGMQTTGSPTEAAPDLTGMAAAGAATQRRRGMRTAGTYAVAATETAAVAPERMVRKDVVGVLPPNGRLEGSVLAKDGVTRLPRADLVLDHRLFGTQHRVTSDRDGSFGVDLPVGAYSLKIVERQSIYESPSTYVVPAQDVLAVDFLLLRDFEVETGDAGGKTIPGKETAAGGVAEAPGRAADSRWLPDPPREPQVVGSVVDLVTTPEVVNRPEGGKWRETLGFLGSILLIALIAF